MHTSIALLTLLSASVLAAPRPVVEVVQIRQILKRQESSPTDLASLIPSNLASLIPSDLATLIPSGIDLNSLIPSGCVPPADLIGPTPPPALVSAIATWTDYCDEPSFTGEAGKQYTSYVSAASSWAEEIKPKFESWLSVFETACPYADMMPSIDPGNTIAMSIASCGSMTKTGTPSARPTGSASSDGAAPIGSGTATDGDAEPTEGGAESTDGGAEPTGAAASDGAAGTGSESPGAAPQQTAFAAAAGVFAGVVGIVAVL